MDIENKLNTKAFKFFDWLFGFVVINLITIILSIFIITLLPAFVAAYATIKGFKENGPTKVIRTYFKNFKKYSEKSFIIGLFIIIIIVVAAFSMWFYGNQFEVTNPIGQAGFWVMIAVLLLVFLFSLHVPLIIINFESFGILDTIRIAIFVCFRYFISSLIIIIADIVIVIGILALPIWVLIGISLPIFLIIKFTEPTYYYLHKIEIEKIIERAKEIENEEDDFGNWENR